MLFDLISAYDRLEVIRQIEINSIEDLMNIPERTMSINIDSKFDPPQRLVIDFRDKEIIIYDDYVE